MGPRCVLGGARTQVECPPTVDRSHDSIAGLIGNYGFICVDRDNILSDIMMMMIIIMMMMMMTIITIITIIIIIIIIIMMMMMMMLLLLLLLLLIIIIIIITIIIAFKGVIQDLLQFPLCASNCLQHIRSNGPGAFMCKARATHRALITCSMSRYVPRGTKGQLS